MSDDDEIAKAFTDTMLHGRGFTRITAEGIKHVPLSEIDPRIVEANRRLARNTHEPHCHMPDGGSECTCSK